MGNTNSKHTPYLLKESTGKTQSLKQILIEHWNKFLNGKADHKNITAVLIAGSGQNSFRVSFDFLCENFGYFRRIKTLKNTKNETFNFTNISELTLQNMLNFLTTGSLYTLFLIFKTLVLSF